MGAVPPARDRVLTKLRKSGTRPDVFLVHPAGGTVFSYYDLLAHSRYDGAVWGLSFPFARLAELTTVERLARAYLAELTTVRPHGPYLLGGHSFGGTVAFEMARQLRMRGEQVAQLLLIDALPPGSCPPLAPADLFAALPEFADSVLGTRLPDTTPAPTDLDGALRLLGRPDWSPEQRAEFRRFLAVFWANSRAMAGYRRQLGRLAVPATVVRATAAEPPALFERLGLPTDLAGRWRHLLAPAPPVLDLPGDHYTMLGDPRHRPALAAVFDAAFDPAAVEALESAA
ncbi:hypothetical protein C7C46_25720 [Streptomyces tateyamensis]|uniref:Thioesterase TesA-like domain-containing protein n=1 Tax=Streptomyces tateyamensis TaxID=565073 RepID=A0A2V4N031_9ACTN|nr:thioesterase domain-containing protein [Streptomyces tateyamensis]PYC72368.1 hypothetical protein C7C46_25720 [Streptomyces tateyamensis]